jgi:hypothetical protein
MPYRQLAYLPDRRSTRIEQSVHIAVRGLDASRTPYEERATALSVNCHGCRYMSRRHVLRGDIATLEVGELHDGRPRYSTQVRVISVKRFGSAEMLFDVAVELDSPKNIWGIASSPEDWCEVPKLPEPEGAARELHIVRQPEQTKAVESKPAAAELPLPSRSLERDGMSSLPPLQVQLMASFCEQIGTSAFETARAAIIKDVGQSLSEFRAQLENEAVST